MVKKAKNKQRAYLQAIWQDGYKGLKTSAAEKEGFDMSQKQIDIGNFRLVKDVFFGGFDLKIIDKTKDLDNTPITENKAAFKHLQTLWRQDIKEIHSKELHAFNLNTRIGKMTFGNLKLSQKGISETYYIDLINKEKGPENKWNDKAVNYKKVLSVLGDFKLTKSKLTRSTEVKLNGELEKHFRNYFENAHKSTGKLRGLFDLVVGDMSFVIEIKLASSLRNVGQRQRASGQIKQYLEEFRSKNFMLLVLGITEDKQDKNIQSIEKEIRKDYDCYFHFIEAE